VPRKKQKKKIPYSNYRVNIPFNFIDFKEFDEAKIIFGAATGSLILHLIKTISSVGDDVADLKDPNIMNAILGKLGLPKRQKKYLAVINCLLKSGYLFIEAGTYHTKETLKALKLCIRNTNKERKKYAKKRLKGTYSPGGNVPKVHIPPVKVIECGILFQNTAKKDMGMRTLGLLGDSKTEFRQTGTGSAQEIPMKCKSALRPCLVTTSDSKNIENSHLLKASEMGNAVSTKRRFFEPKLGVSEPPTTYNHDNGLSNTTDTSSTSSSYYEISDIHNCNPIANLQKTSSQFPLYNNESLALSFSSYLFISKYINKYTCSLSKTKKQEKDLEVYKNIPRDQKPVTGKVGQTPPQCVEGNVVLRKRISMNKKTETPKGKNQLEISNMELKKVEGVVCEVKSDICAKDHVAIKTGANRSRLRNTIFAKKAVGKVPKELQKKKKKPNKVGASRKFLLGWKTKDIFEWCCYDFIGFYLDQYRQLYDREDYAIANLHQNNMYFPTKYINEMLVAFKDNNEEFKEYIEQCFVAKKNKSFWCKEVLQFNHVFKFTGASMYPSFLSGKLGEENMLERENRFGRYDDSADKAFILAMTPYDKCLKKFQDSRLQYVQGFGDFKLLASYANNTCQKEEDLFAQMVSKDIDESDIDKYFDSFVKYLKVHDKWEFLPTLLTKLTK